MQASGDSGSAVTLEHMGSPSSCVLTAIGPPGRSTAAVAAADAAAAMGTGEAGGRAPHERGEEGEVGGEGGARRREGQEEEGEGEEGGSEDGAESDASSNFSVDSSFLETLKERAEIRNQGLGRSRLGHRADSQNSTEVREPPVHPQ